MAIPQHVKSPVELARERQPSRAPAIVVLSLIVLLGIGMSWAIGAM